MANGFIEKMLGLLPFWSRAERQELAQPLPHTGRERLVRVYVEGYEDVSFWRSIFDHFQNPYLRFEISVPNDKDLPKGKKVLLNMLPSAGEDLLLCMDSDFDFLMQQATEQSRMVNSSPFLFHTYVYATENFLCYAETLHNVCVKATKNDTRIFDFVQFMAHYSCIIYPLFLWYVYSARHYTKHIFSLVDFKNTVRIGYLDIPNNGAATLEWVARNVQRTCRRLSEKYPELEAKVVAYGAELSEQGLRPDNTYLFMHGHTLLDNVVMPILQTVCEQLRRLSIERIHHSMKKGTVAFNNEMSNYKNAQRSIRDVLLDNDNYTDCYLYKRLHRRIEEYIRQTVEAMKCRGEIHPDSRLEFPLAKRLKELRALNTLKK